MSTFNNNCFVINIKIQLSKLQQIRQPLVESKWLVTKSVFRLQWGLRFFSSSEDNVASAILLTHSPLPQPRSQSFSLPVGGRGEGGAGRVGKALGTRLRVLVINYHVHNST